MEKSKFKKQIPCISFNIKIYVQVKLLMHNQAIALILQLCKLRHAVAVNSYQYQIHINIHFLTFAEAIYINNI